MATFFKILLVLMILVCLVDFTEAARKKGRKRERNRKNKGNKDKEDDKKEEKVDTVEEPKKESYMMLFQHHHDTANEMTLKITDPVANLHTLNFDDRTSRVQVFGDIAYELYSEPNFHGYRMFVKPGPRINAAHDDWYSSARKVCTYDNNPESAKVIVYENSNLQGDSKEFYGAETDLTKVRMEKYQTAHWDNKISSVHAVKGDWELYQHPDFTGKRWLFKEGEAITLGSGFFWSDHDKGSSIRPVCSTYKPVVTCTPYQVEILDSDDLEPMIEGVEVIGSQSGGTCSATGTHTMTLSNTDSVTETVSLETSTAEEYNWQNSQEFGLALIGAPWGVGAAISMSWTESKGGSVTMTSSETKSFSTGNEKSASQSVTYDAPGAGLIFGVVERFVYDKSNTPTKIYLKCSDGTEKTEEGRMKLRSVTFPSVNYWSWSGKFDEKECKKNSNLPECVNNVRRKYQKMDFDTNQAKVDRNWDKCFEDGKGISKLK